MSETFTLQLATVAEPAALEEWLADPAAERRVVYATGLDLPATAPGVELVRGWIEQGTVVPFRQRDAADRRRWQFIAEKRGLGVPGEAADLAAPTGPSPEVRARADALLALLGELLPARQPARCPGLAKLAQRLQLGRSEAARQKVQRALCLLAKEGRITMETTGPKHMRVRMVTLTGAPRHG